MINAVRFRFYKGFSLRIVLLFLLLFLFQNSFGQNPANVVPQYDWLKDVGLPNVTVSGLNSNDINIAVASGPENYVYILTFGNGVQRRNADGTGKVDQFISGLDSPLDIAVDEKGYIYIADFQAGGETYEDNGKVKVYDSNGVYQYSVLTSYFRPMGIDVDSKYLYIAEYNNGEQGPERTPSSRVRIVDKSTGIVKAKDENVTLPYRIAISEKTKHVYVSQAGNSTSTVRIYNQSLSFLGNLPGIQSPGSVIVDSFGFIHVIEYTNRVNFEDFIRLSTDFDLGELLELSHDIRDGVADNAFFIRIYNSSEVLQNREITDYIDFPIDIASSECDNFYVDNSKIFGTHVDNFFTHSFFPSRIEFDLEIYQRTPSADITPPESICVSDFEITLNSSATKTITAEDIDDGSNDLCGDVTLTIDKESFTAANEGDNTVTLTVTDEQGNESSCTTIVKVIVEEAEDTEAPEFDCPDNIEVDNDPGVCGAVVNFESPNATDDSGETPTMTQTEGPVSGNEFPVGSTTITFTATDGSNNSSTCSFDIIVEDNEAPVIDCSDNIWQITLPEGETYLVPDFETELQITDNCDTNLSYSQTPGVDAPIEQTTDVLITVTDSAGNTSNCTVTIEITTEEQYEFECIGELTVNLGDDAINSPVKEIPTSEFITSDISNLEFELTNQQFTCDDIGTFPLVINAKDKDTGEEYSCTVNVTVKDVGKPLIICPAEVQTREIPANGVYELPEVVDQFGISDNCSDYEELEIVQVPAPGTEITEEGNYDITLTVTDKYNNVAVCEVTYRLINTSDTEPPVIDCPEDIELSNDNGVCGALVEFETPLATDNSGDPVVERTDDTGLNSGKVFPVGTTTISYVARDAAGNEDTCSFKITVTDDQAPVIECKSAYTFTFQSGTTGILDPKDLLNSYRDNCDGQNIVLEADRSQFTAADDGNTINVTVTATDSNGNSSNCTIPVTIELSNQEILRINCPQNYTVPADGNCNYWVPDFSTVVSTTIEGATITQDVLAGSSFDPNSDPYIRVTATYQDQSDYCDIYLQPEDQMAPFARCILEYQVTVNEGETVEVDPANLDGGSMDNCGIASFSLSQTQFTSDDEGLRNIQFIVTDNAGNTDECTVAIMVVVNSDGNQAPIANIDRYEVPGNQILNVSAENGILANDFDPEGDDLSIVLVNSTNFGTLTLNDDGSFQYIPDTDFFGKDTFTYYVTDGELNSETVEVSIHMLQGQNLQPIVIADEYITLINTVLNIDAPGVLINDYDPEGVELRAFLLDDASNGTVVLQEDGSFTYTPDNGFVGEDRFSYYATDEGGEGVATVTITVVDDSEGYPIAKADFYETDFNTTLNVSAQDGILANDSDPNGDEIFAVLVEDVANGLLELNSDGSFTYTPENGFSGTDFFTYHATDGEFNSSTVTVSITVNPEENTGDFRCAEDLTVFLREDATQTIAITSLYSGSADGLTLEASQLTFGCEDVGETEITLTYSGAQDGSCVIPVTVIDRTAPDLQLRDITLQIGEEGSAVLNFQDIDIGSSDLCSEEVTYELSQTEFTCDDFGNNLVEVTATDNYGNSATETIIVTVEGENCGNLPPGTKYTFVYPNPNSGSFTVATPSDVSITRIEVFDHRGRFIAAKDFKGDRMEYSMDVGPLQEAAYVLKIKSNKKDIIRRIIIKN